MKPADQVKVIVLSFLAIVVMVGFIVVVSKITHNTYMSHHAEAGHGEAEAGHGDSHGEASQTSEDSHGDTHAKTEDTHATKPDAAADHAADAQHDTDKAADKSTDAAKVVAVSGNAEAGAQVFMAKTCATCHAISSMAGAVGAVGPKLDGLGATAATRESGKDALTYIRESIENPNGYVVDGYPAAMPALKSTMSDEEFENLVAYLASL